MIAISEDFERRTDPFKRELLAHCYRMLGSVHDAENLLQETMLRAWRARDRFDAGRASLRTWLYHIATNACLNALESRNCRPLPSGMVGPSDDPEAPMVPRREVPWLQPFPDAMLEADREDPATALATRGSLRLAFVAAMQYLAPRQRAVLVLRDVLDRSAAEVAGALDTTPAAVNSALQRARARLEEVGVGEDQIDEPSDPGHRALIDQYVTAFENADVAALERLLTDDAVLEMPPVLNWFVGREAYGRFVTHLFAMRGSDWRMISTAANGQPAVAAYLRGQDGAYHVHTLQVFTVTDHGISHNVVFQDSSLFATFGLPPRLGTI
ncbi:MAG TPA: sigma-70 family RNA polymerase sigma factor [Propionibacteriaceae bacterium]|nr:sigma-70 family RNA polymerase sigma factor [Propionibacteriaceae bacterium]